MVSEYDGIRSYRPMQVVYWLVNPYYEKIYEQVEDKSDLLSLRDEFLSKEFWEYVYERLLAVKRQGYDYLKINREFSSAIKALFRCNISNETKQITLPAITVKLLLKMGIIKAPPKRCFY